MSDIALQKAAQAWCAEDTSHKTMDVELASAFAKILDGYMEALIWCSGSQDFAPEGFAREGWLKLCQPLLE